MFAPINKFKPDEHMKTCLRIPFIDDKQECQKSDLLSLAVFAKQETCVIKQSE